MSLRNQKLNHFLNCETDIPQEANAEIYYTDPKLIEKITTQAKRLTKLASEKEELLEMLREKTATIDSSFNNGVQGYPILTTTSNQFNRYNNQILNHQRILFYENEIEKLTKENKAFIIQIKDLEKTKTDLSNFKETISKRLNNANEDIEKTKNSLMTIQKEKEDLSKSKLQLEKKIKTLEEHNQTLQNENCELSLQVKKFQNLQKELTQKLDNQIMSLNNKNKKMFHDNRDLSTQIQSLSKTIKNLNEENQNLKKTNALFISKIDKLTQQMNIFQTNINKQIQVSNTIEIENKTKELISLLKTKDLEISKLKEVNNNYVLLENELSTSLKEKTAHYSKMKNDFNSMLNELNQFKLENQNLKNQIQSFALTSNQQISDNTINHSQNTIINQLQNATQIKNTQIINLKKQIDLLETKNKSVITQKNYLEHLLIYTHPHSEKIKQILEIYKEILELEEQKQKFEKEYIFNKTGKEDEKNKQIKQNAANNINEQIQMLKQSLQNMEEEIKFDNQAYNNNNNQLINSEYEISYDNDSQ
jgi:predicted  nucleic acid-binding Zn-ribbon protein